MNWVLTIPLLTSTGAAVLKHGGKEISWLWVCLPLIGIGLTLMGVLLIAGLQELPGFFAKLQMPITFLALPLTTLALMVKMVRVSL